jgi:hypothetical protein
MSNLPPSNLVGASEEMHRCRAVAVQSVPAQEAFQGQPVWEGTVHVFDLKGHPTATRACAWSSPTEGSTKRRFFAMLHRGGITSPTDAVRAAIVAKHRAKSQSP